MKKEVKLYKTTSVSFATEPDAVFFVKGVSETVVRTYITTSDGQAIPLKDLSGGGSGSGIQFLVSGDSSIEVTGTTTSKNIQVSSALQTLINSALQSGDSISTLINDAGYITLADVPTFNPSDYDLSDFTNSSPDPFVKQSELTSGVTNLGYTASPTNGVITSDTGSDATIPLADNTNAGLLSPAEKSEIATAIQPSDLGAVATSNDYNDLDNIPTSFPPSAHAHVEADITDLDKYTQAQTDTLLATKQNTLGFTPENVTNKNNIILNNSSTEYPTSGLVLKEREPIVVSSNVTATLNREHNVVANTTITDPTPTEGMGYYVNVINGIATVGGVYYSVGTQLFRHYHSGSWRTFVYPSTLQLENFLRDETLLKGYVCSTPSGINAPNGFRDVTYSSSATTGYFLQNNYGKTGAIGMVGFQSTAVAGTVAFKRRNDSYIFTNTNATIWQKIEFDSNVSGARFHHLLSNNFQFTAPTNVNQTSLLNCVGFCKLSTSDNLHVIHNDSSGTATTVDLGASFPANNSSGNKRYLLGIQIKATSYVLTVIEINTTTNALTTNIYTTEVSTDIPARSLSPLQISTMITNNATASNATYLDGGLVATNLF